VGIAAGPDGNVWVTEAGAHSIGRVTTAGAVHEYALPSKKGEPALIAPGPGGTLWFTVPDTDHIGRVTLH
jgi:virginiamycin B lyase